jgi:hypothetical protein
MDTEHLQQILSTSNKFFEQWNGQADVTDGWKISIQGKTVEHAVYLFKALDALLIGSRCSFKLGTQKLINQKHPQQCHKLMTIYIPNGVDVKSFAELVYINLKGYKGGEDIKCPTSYEHYANAIYFRNDRDETGQYIPAN